MKKLYFIANHPAPAELVEQFEVISLTAEQKVLWSNIPKTSVAVHISPILADVKSVVDAGGIVVAVGEPRACFLAATTAGQGNVFSTFSVRKSVEKQLPDGTVEKTSVFQFDGLVPYEF
jgi:hypothetical protein